MRSVRLIVAVVLLAVGCTKSSSTAASSSATGTTSTSGSATSEPTITTLGDGSPLPEGCVGSASASETVAFVGGGRAWALDPATSDLDCLFELDDPGPFAWGPLGDRVVVGGFEVRGVGKSAPDLPPTGTVPETFDWSSPTGLAVVFAGDDGVQKRFVDDGRVEPLPRLPQGDVSAIAYHPSGRALAFVLERNGKQSIWIATYRGEDPTRLVFSNVGTRFTSIAFSPDGARLWWMAEHKKGFAELHYMDLDDRSDFQTAWTGKIGTYADELLLSPGLPLEAFTMGATCDERRAMVLEGASAAPVPDDEQRPSEAIGWLDEGTLLVRVGGCGDLADIAAVDVRNPHRDAVELANDVEVAASRTILENAPTTVPTPKTVEEEPPPGGLG